MKVINEISIKRETELFFRFGAILTTISSCERFIFLSLRHRCTLQSRQLQTVYFSFLSVVPFFETCPRVLMYLCPFAER